MEPLRVIAPEPAVYRGHRSRTGLPEQVDWRDDGCEVAPACLECPLVRCRYDEPGGIQSVATRERYAEIRAAYLQDDADVEALARRFDVSRRTVWRAIAGLSGRKERARG